MGFFCSPLLCLAAALFARPQSARADADVLWAAGERLEAIETLSAALARTPGDAALRNTLVEREMAVHRYAAALEHAQGLGHEADPARGYCLHRLGRFEEAVPLLDVHRPDQALLVFDTLELLGRAEEARRALDEAERTLGALDPGVLVRRGRTAAAAGRYEEAEGFYRRALDQDAI